MIFGLIFNNMFLVYIGKENQVLIWMYQECQRSLVITSVLIHQQICPFLQEILRFSLRNGILASCNDIKVFYRELVIISLCIGIYKVMHT